MREPVTRPEMRFAGPVLDSPNPRRLAEFYHTMLGWEIARSEGPRPGYPSSDGWVLLRAPGGEHKLEVQWEPHYVAPTWPPADGEQLMMVHLDFGVDDLEEAVEWACHAGATVADHQPQDDVRVMLDPDGHPFCLFPDRR